MLKKFLIAALLIPAAAFGQQWKLIIAGNSGLILPPPIFFTSTDCEGFDTTITIPTFGSDSVIIQSAGLLGFPNGYAATDLPDTLAGGTRKNYHLNFRPPNPGIEHGTLSIHYVVGGIGFDTSIAITCDFRSRGIVKTIMRDVLNAGDTVSLPIYLASTRGDPMHGFSISAHFNTELLTPLDPEFKSTLTNGAVIWKQTPSSSGLNLFVEQHYFVEDTAPLVILRFATAVTKSKCTTFFLDSLQLYDSSGGIRAACPLEVLLDSATICLADFCGETTLRNYLDGIAPTFSVSYNKQTDMIAINDQIKTPHEIEIFNMLGEVVKIISSTTGKSNISVSALPSGIYIVRTSNSGTASQKISVMR